MNNKINQTNVDLNEIEKFSALADDWWDPNGYCKPLHIINPFRLSYIKQQCGNLAGKKILDVGCGGGILTESLAKEEAIMTGIDLAQRSIEIAKQHANANKLTINYQCKSVELLAQEQHEKFDIITCMELLEHVPDPQSIISASAKLLKKEGKLFLSTINRNMKSHLMLIIGAEYITQYVPKGTHNFKKFIRPSELIKLAEQAKLKTDDIIGLEYNLLKNQFSLSKNVDINYIMMTSLK